MTYDELIVKALHGRSVNSAAKAWGVKQQNLDRWVKGMSMPNYNTALKIADDAGVDAREALETFAEQERIHASRNFKLQMGFGNAELAGVLAMIALVVNLFLTPTTAKAAPLPYESSIEQQDVRFILCQMEDAFALVIL